jgi:monoamine oxidase
MSGQQQMADRIVVVGGGLTGLVAAHELQSRGLTVVVLEAADRIGGRIGTEQFPDGATAERCMEEFWDTSPAHGLLQRLGIPVIDQPACSSMIIDDGLHPYRARGGTAQFFDELFDACDRSAFNRWNKTATGVLAELAVATSMGTLSDRLMSLTRASFAAYVHDLGLSCRVRAWIRIVVESESAIEWDRIAALDGIEEMRPFLIADSGESARNSRVSGGNERLIERLASTLGSDAVRLNARVRRVVDHGGANGVSVVYEDECGDCHIEHGDHVLLTPPLWALREIDLEPVLDRLSRAAIESSAAGSYVKVILRLRPDMVDIEQFDGEYPFTLLTDGPAGCVYLKDGRAIGRDHVLTMLIHGRWARLLNGRSRDAILACGVRSLEGVVATAAPCRAPRPIMRGVSAAVTDAKVFDYPNAVAYWPNALGRSRFDQLSAALRAPHGRVLIGGDSTDSSHSDGAVAAGQRMAAAITATVGSLQEACP